MARRVQTVIEDDFDGGRADETVQFQLDGTDYEIDLSRQHAAEFRHVLADYVRAGRRAGRPRTAKPAVGKKAGLADQAADIRRWAFANGYELARQGRIPAKVRQAYARKTAEDSR